VAHCDLRMHGLFVRATVNGDTRYLCAGSCSVRSTTLALGAFVLIASMPFSALALVSYPWLAAMISPLAALMWNLYLFAGFVLADLELGCRCSSPCSFA
jgi:hypothetical protein